MLSLVGWTKQMNNIDRIVPIEQMASLRPSEPSILGLKTHFTFKYIDLLHVINATS